ncbi:hypothetical protein GGF31_002083 [Allomyces arbusculus]|nr:hypothetical protein GGF31_002083 [Allomyces arbusculus]
MRSIAASLPHLASLELGGLSNVSASAVFPAVNVIVASCPLRRLVLAGFVVALSASTRSGRTTVLPLDLQTHLRRPLLEELLLDAHPIPYFHLTVAIHTDVLARLRVLKVHHLTLVPHTLVDEWFQVLDQCTGPPRTPPPQLIMPRLEALDLTVSEIQPVWLPIAPNLQCLVLVTLSAWKAAAVERILVESFPNLTDLILPGVPPHATQRVDITSQFAEERDPWLLAGDAWGLDARNGHVGHACDEFGRVTLAWLLKAWKLAVPEEG